MGIMHRDSAKKRRRYRFGELTEGQFEILHALVGKNFKDKLNKYRIYREVSKIRRSQFGRGRGPSLSDFYDKFRYLEQNGLVKCSNGSYALTLKGLILVSDVDVWAKINEVAQNQPELLPLIFNNWARFDEFGIKENLIQELQSSFEFILRLPTTQNIGGIYVTGEPLLKMSEKELEFRIMQYIFGPPTRNEEGKAWIKVILNDSKLSEFVMRLWELELILPRIEIIDLEDGIKAINRKNPEILDQVLVEKNRLLNERETRQKAVKKVLE